MVSTITGSKDRSKKTDYPNLIISISIPLFLWFISGYNLSLDALFANSVAKIFFPASDFTYSLLAVYGIVSLSLLARFGGAVVLGRIGDKYQRKTVVAVCLILLIIGMFGSLLLVFYNELLNNALGINIVSSLFILTRILVGFSIGGLWPTASVWGLENRAFNRRFTDCLFTEKRYQEYIRKDLLPYGGTMQFGFHLGWFTSAFLVYYFWIKTPHILSIAPHVILQYGLLSIIGCVMGVAALVFCGWKMNPSKILIERKESLKIAGKIHELGSIKTLFTTHRKALFNLWLIMNGLFFLYYPSTIITTKLLTIKGFTSTILFGILPKDMPINIFLFFILLLAHGLPVIVYWILRIWHREDCSYGPNCRRGKVMTFITKCYLDLITNCYFYLYRLSNGIYAVGGSLLGLTDSGRQQNTSSKDEAKREAKAKRNEIIEISKKNIDIVIIILTGFLLVGIVLIGFVLINISKSPEDWATFTSKDLGLVLYTSIVIFFANTIWTLIPSLLSGSFPTELRNTASTLIYQGGLVIAFSSPFISMQYFLLVDQHYLLIIPIILGAVSIIIGGARMVGVTRNQVNNKLLYLYGHFVLLLELLVFACN